MSFIRHRRATSPNKFECRNYDSKKNFFDTSAVEAVIKLVILMIVIGASSTLELSYVDTYFDNGFTGTNFKRPAFTRLQIVKLAAIHHVAIIVSDYEKSKDFYVNKLGFAVVRENFRKERNDWKLDLCVGDGADAIELEIFAEPNPPKRVNRPEACGLRHLAFRVENVEATVEELAQMGIECEPIRLDSYTKKKMTFFFDPDGLPLELHE